MMFFKHIIMIQQTLLRYCIISSCVVEGQQAPVKQPKFTTQIVKRPQIGKVKRRIPIPRYGNDRSNL